MILTTAINTYISARLLQLMITVEPQIRKLSLWVSSINSTVAVKLNELADSIQLSIKMQSMMPIIALFGASIPGLFGMGFHIGFTGARILDSAQFIKGIYHKVSERMTYNNGTTFAHISGELALFNIARRINSDPYGPSKDLQVANEFMMYYSLGKYIKAYEKFTDFGSRLGEYGHFKGYYGRFISGAGGIGAIVGVFSGAAYAWFEASLGRFDYGISGTADLSILVP